MNSVFDPAFSSAPRARMYQAWVAPDLAPGERQPVLKNWSDEEITMYCGTRKEYN